MRNVRVIYNNGEFEVKHHKNYRGSRKYRIVNIKHPDLHTHRYSKKESIDLCNFAKHNNIPRDSEMDYLESLSRILHEDNPLKWKVDKLIHTKKDKKEGNQRHYINIQRGQVQYR